MHSTVCGTLAVASLGRSCHNCYKIRAHRHGLRSHWKRCADIELHVADADAATKSDRLPLSAFFGSPLAAVSIPFLRAGSVCIRQRHLCLHDARASHRQASVLGVAGDMVNLGNIGGRSSWGISNPKQDVIGSITFVV